MSSLRIGFSSGEPMHASNRVLQTLLLAENLPSVRVGRVAACAVVPLLTVNLRAAATDAVLQHARAEPEGRVRIEH